MRININQIPPEGLTLEEEVSASELDLETDIVKFLRPINIKVEISKITNVVTVDLSLSGSMYLRCSRCLNETEADFKKKLKLNYSVNKLEPFIHLDSDIRDQIILDYPIKPLCQPDCKGICPKCGKNLNEGTCGCRI